MGLKSIFREGLKERQRRKSLGKLTRELKEKNKAHAELLTALGRQAWESRVDISAFAENRSALEQIQKELDDLRIQSEQLQKQKQDHEDKKKQESDRFSAVQREVEEKKRETDKRLSEQKSTLQSGQKETQHARSRLAAIAAERTQLQNKNAVMTISETEKAGIATGLNILAKEEEALQAGIGCRAEADKPLMELLAALQEDSSRLNGQIDGSRQEQKQIESDFDKKITALKGTLAKNNEKSREAENRLKDNFRQLGGKLVAAGSADPGLAKETAAVRKARTEMDGIQALLDGLDRQKDGGQVSAYWKMMAIIIAAIVLLAAIFIALFLLLSPK